MELHEMEKEKEPYLHLDHHHLEKMGFPAEHKPQPGDKYHLSGVVHVESVSEHASEAGEHSHHVSMKMTHMGMKRHAEHKSHAEVLYGKHREHEGVKD